MKTEHAKNASCNIVRSVSQSNVMRSSPQAGHVTDYVPSLRQRLHFIACPSGTALETRLRAILRLAAVA